MKKILRTLLALAVAATAAACSNDVDDTTATEPVSKMVPVEISACAPAQSDTRTSIDINGSTFATRWSDGDRMAVSYKNPTASGVVPFTYDKASGKFRSELPAYTGDWTYDAFLPHYASAPTFTDADGTVFQTAFGNHRTQNGSNFNYMYDPLLATRIVTTGAEAGKDNTGGELNFEFQRLTSILKCKISGGSESQKIKSVLLTAPDGNPVSSSFIRSNSSIEMTPQDDVSPLSNVIAVTFDEGTAPSTADAEVYFNLLPIPVTGLQIDVITEDGKIAGRKYTSELALAPGELTLLNFDNLTFRDVPKPSLSWPDQDMNGIHDITVDESGALSYDAAISITAPAGIAGLQVKITSDVLNGADEDGDGVKDGITQLDLFNETSILGAIPYSSLGLDCSTLVQYKKSTVFNITGLIPFISGLSPKPGDLHVFEVHVTDLAGRETTQALTFRTPEAVAPTPTITYNNDADAWTNTATLNLNNVPTTAQSVTVEYKTASGTEWIPARLSTDGKTATIAPQWESYTTADWTTPNTVKAFNRIKPGTGVSKGNTYQYRMTIDGTVYEGTSFDGPATQNPAFDSLNNSALPCYQSISSNKLHESQWWCSGNNNFTKSLCTHNATYNAAYLKTKYNTIIIKALAAGNLFTGQFNMGTTSGTVQFGQPYAWEARPKAVKIRYDAKIGLVDVRQHKKGDDYPIAEGVRDYARIFVAIVDWQTPRKVASGTSGPSGTWDPETISEMSDEATYGGGKIIAYASKWIQQESYTGSLQTEELDFNYYDTDAKPSSNYTIVISCSSNAYGDYMCGYQLNEMYVGDFEWVY